MLVVFFVNSAIAIWSPDSDNSANLSLFDVLTFCDFAFTTSFKNYTQIPESLYEFLLCFGYIVTISSNFVRFIESNFVPNSSVLLPLPPIDFPSNTACSQQFRFVTKCSRVSDPFIIFLDRKAIAHLRRERKKGRNTLAQFRRSNIKNVVFLPLSVFSKFLR